MMLAHQFRSDPGSWEEPPAAMMLELIYRRVFCFLRFGLFGNSFGRVCFSQLFLNLILACSVSLH
jgi:hypothetical protein